MKLLLGAIRKTTTCEGPGNRFAIWVQGCTLKCSGCFNPQFWGTHGGKSVTPVALFSQVKQAKTDYPNLEGVTILGGEPFEQPTALSEFIDLLGSLDLTVMVFSGYTIEELQDESHSKFVERQELLSRIDLLVDGRFERNQIDNVRPWAGSTNQRFHYLTNRYSPESLFNNSRDAIEIHVLPSGIVKINGWAEVDKLELLIDSL